MDREERVERIARHAQELLTREELVALLERTERPRAYIGFEPSGRLTVGHLVCARKMIDLQEAGCELTVFLADWHAWINDKLGGSLDRIAASGQYMRSAFQALGVSEGATRWRWAHELTGSSEYWSRVVRVAKTTSLARTKRAMTILGRSEEEEGLDTAKLFYPSMQAADMFELPVDLAYAGLDQRRAHVLAREVAHHYDWPVPVALHTPLVSSLKGGARMDPANVAEHKMSKSDPTGAITLPSTPEEVSARLKGAFCPAREVEGNPVVELALHVVFPWRGRLTVHRAPQHGGDRTFETPSQFHAAWTGGELHPADLKAAVASEIADVIRPVNEYFAHRAAEAPAAF
jgi:tyrosyl-tRNA synthetase